MTRLLALLAGLAAGLALGPLAAWALLAVGYALVHVWTLAGRQGRHGIGETNG